MIKILSLYLFSPFSLLGLILFIIFEILLKFLLHLLWFFMLWNSFSVAIFWFWGKFVDKEDDINSNLDGDV